MERTNDFLSYSDYQLALKEIMAPIREAIIQSPKPGLHLGTSGAVYDQKRSDMEALVRPLWGLAPYWTREKDDELRDAYLAKLIKGTDPLDSDYWGDTENYDQYIVEMAAISLTLLLHKEYIWEQLSLKNQQQLVQWLKQALTKRIPKNNWTFFKVLIRIALFHCGEPLDKETLTEELQLIDSMYLGEGWYFDGKISQKDYYIPFAFHYYGLIFATFMKEEMADRAAKFTARATRFAQDFIYYFDEEGEALPYGRSSTYRFAQGAFFSALVFANVEAIPWGQIKTLLSGHLKTWLNHEIFTFDGRLSIGYHYENLVMAEGYNAPGSPYWALKFFLLLAAKDNHSFWQAEPLSINLEKRRLVNSGNMLLLHEKNGQHLLGFPAGMMLEGQAHAEAKYSKFVYSTKFGFSVPKAGVKYEEGAFDNTLAVSLDGNYFRSKRETVAFELREDRIVHEWSPFETVKIKTAVYPLGEWHVRVHEIETEEALEIREGGFSAPLRTRNVTGKASKESAFVTEGALTSRIVAIEGYEEAKIIQPEVNTSLFFPRTSLPYLQKRLQPGKHQLICLVGGIFEEEKRK